jgi:DNA-directed RNA polymerase III subunit RPC7
VRVCFWVLGKMSFRGRGRGRGGRFGGPPGILPRDEDGNVVIPKKQEGPPPLYPKLQQLPDLPTITPRDEMLIKRRRQLDLALNSSPYYIEKPKAKTEGVVAEIERYSDRYRVNIRANRPPLSSVLKLAPAYFPVELLGQGLHCCSPFSVG